MMSRPGRAADPDRRAARRRTGWRECEARGELIEPTGSRQRAATVRAPAQARRGQGDLARAQAGLALLCQRPPDVGDMLSLQDDVQDGEPLLRPAMRGRPAVRAAVDAAGGARATPPPSSSVCRSIPGGSRPRRPTRSRSRGRSRRRSIAARHQGTRAIRTDDLALRLGLLAVRASSWPSRRPGSKMSGGGNRSRDATPRDGHAGGARWWSSPSP
jgi:hypothetical protein